MVHYWFLTLTLEYWSHSRWCIYIYICEVTNQPDPVLVQIFLAKSSALRRSLAVYQILCFLLCLLLFSQHWHCTLRTAGSDCASCYYVTELLDVQNCGCLPYCQCQEDKETITCVTFESLLEKKKIVCWLTKVKCFWDSHVLFKHRRSESLKYCFHD